VTQSEEFIKLRDKIASFIAKEGFTISDFQQGLAKKTGSNNQYKIGKILNSMRKKYPVEADELLKLYAESKSGESDYLIVVSRHPYDVAGASTGRSWAHNSCMSLEYRERNTGAVQWKTVPHAIELGAMVAFLIRKDDKNINDPLARIFIKPYFNESETAIVYKPDQTIYGKYDKLFLSIVNDWVEKKNKEAADEFRHALVDVYTLGKGIYNQEGKASILKIKDLRGNVTDEDLMNIVKSLAKMDGDAIADTVSEIKKSRPDIINRLYDTIVEFLIKS
jgi:hypothetical protein